MNKNKREEKKHFFEREKQGRSISKDDFEFFLKKCNFVTLNARVIGAKRENLKYSFLFSIKFFD